MSSVRSTSRRGERRRRRRWPRVVASLAGALAVFAAGYGLGRALDDNPEQGPMVTTVRTLKPLPAVTTGP